MKIIYSGLRLKNQAAVLIHKYDFDQNLIEVEKKNQIRLKFRSFFLHFKSSFRLIINTTLKKSKKNDVKFYTRTNLNCMKKSCN